VFTAEFGIRQEFGGGKKKEEQKKRRKFTGGLKQRYKQAAALRVITESVQEERSFNGGGTRIQA